MPDQFKEVHSQNVRLEVHEGPVVDEIRFKTRTPEVLHLAHANHGFANDKTYVIKIYEVTPEPDKKKKASA